MGGAKRIKYDPTRCVIIVEWHGGPPTDFDEHRHMRVLMQMLSDGEWRVACVALFERVGEWVEVGN